MKRKLLALSTAIALALAIAAPVTAAPSKTPPSKLTATVTMDATEVHHGDLVTFTGTLHAEYPWRFALLCTYEGDIVLAGGGTIRPGTQIDDMGLASPASQGVYAENPDAVLDCTVDLVAYISSGNYHFREVIVDGNLDFVILP